VKTDAPEALRHEAERYGSAMLDRFGWFHWLLGLRRPIGRMRMDEASAERIRTAAERGPIVYVMLRANNLDHLALNRVLSARELPLSIWGWDETQFFWQPVGKAWSGLFSRAWRRLTGQAPPDPATSGFVARATRAGAPLTVFLEASRSLWHRVFLRKPADPLPALFEAQADLEQPIQLLPVLVVWQRGLDRQAHPALRAVRTDPDRVWWVWRLIKLAWYPSDNFVQVGEPVDLREFLERVPDRPARRRTLTVLLRRYLRREGSVVRGPRLPSAADLRRMVLDNPPMRELASQEATRAGTSVESVRREMEREYDRIAAHMRWWVIRILDLVLRPLWTVVYSGVDAPEEDMERIREAMRQGAAIIVPSHKSHLDYILLAWVFYRHKLTLPHVVAGANLAIPVVAFFLRSCGGFFIKRSFEGEHLHPPIFARYLRELIHHGVPIEFYLEGGRTRSGKLLPPKVGVLGMVFDAAALRPTGREVTLLPVALAYEQVAEQRAYLRELGGKNKRKEDLGQAVKATRVFGRRLGRVYLRVGTPIPVSQHVDAAESRGPWLERDPQEHKQVLHDTARLVMSRIGDHTVLLPTTLVALALLAHHRRGITQHDLMARIHRFQAFTRRHGLPEAKSLARLDEAVRLTLDRLASQRVLEHFAGEDQRVWAVRVGRRLQLDFNKNQGLHPFGPAGVVASVLRARPTDVVTAESLAESVDWLAHLWRRELALPPQLDALGLARAGLDDLVQHGALGPDPLGRGGLRVADAERMGEIHGLFRPFLEAYRIVSNLARGLDGTGPGRKDWVRSVQRQQERLVQEGLLTRPEALSLVTLENAVKVLMQDGQLQDRDGHLAADAPACRALEDRLAPMVGR